MVSLIIVDGHFNLPQRFLCIYALPDMLTQVPKRIVEKLEPLTVIKNSEERVVTIDKVWFGLVCVV